MINLNALEMMIFMMVSFATQKSKLDVLSSKIMLQIFSSSLIIESKPIYSK